MTRFLKIINLLLIAILFVIGGYILGKKYTLALDQNQHIIIVKNSANEEKLRKIFNLIDNYYVENINSDSLIEVTLNNLLTQLDPHSMYLDSKQSKQNLSIENSYLGLGIQHQNIQDTLVITHIYPNSSAQKQCRIGDKIIKVNGVSAIKKDNQFLSDFINNNTNITFNIIRNHTNITAKLHKSDIYIPAVNAAFMLNETLGYIRLDRFSKDASIEVKNAILNLQKKGMKKLVFDLRDNPGGLLDEAEKISDEFLPDKKLIVYIQDKNNKKEFVYSHTHGAFEQQEIFVLINENAASASEVVAGSLQDNDRATIIGRRSFGKGLVQREIDLGDGSKLRLTTANYYTPTGRNIQKPYKNQREMYENDMLERIHTGELYDKSKIKINDSLKKKTPKGKIVYGGGGIVPDVFVPIQHFDVSADFYDNQGFLYTQQFAIDFIEKNYHQFQSLPKNEFITNFTVQEIQKEYAPFIKKKNIQITQSQLQNLSVFIKAQLARMLYDDDAYYQVWNPNDAMIKVAIELAK